MIRAHVRLAALALALASACAPELAGGGDDEVIDLGPLRLVLELPTKAGLSPLEDADELVINVRDLADSRSRETRLRVSDPDDRAIEDVPWGDAIDVTVEARSSTFDIVTGYGEARGVRVRGDEELRIRLLRRLVYSNVNTWDASQDGAPLWVTDVGVVTATEDRLDAPVVDTKVDHQLPQDLYLTSDARTLVVACVDYNEPDPWEPALGRLRIYDTRDNDLVGDTRPDLATNEVALPVPLAFARPLADGYRLAGLSNEAPTLFLVDVRTGEIETHALQATPPAQWSVSGVVTARAGGSVWVSAQVNDEAKLIRVVLNSGAPRIEEVGAGLDGAEARGLALSADGTEVYWALSQFLDVIGDGDAIYQSAVEVRAPDLDLRRTVLMPANDFNIAALSRVPDGRLVGSLALIDRTPDDCCRGSALFDPDDTAPTLEPLPFGVSDVITGPSGDGFAVLDDHGNELVQLVMFPRDGGAPIGIQPQLNAYYDAGSAVAVPYGRR
jgi:hypothetical protein